MSKLPPIPASPRSQDREHARFTQAVKEFLEVLSGRRGVQIEPLSDDATLGEVIGKINALITRIQRGD